MLNTKLSNLCTQSKGVFTRSKNFVPKFRKKKRSIAVAPDSAESVSAPPRDESYSTPDPETANAGVTRPELETTRPAEQAGGQQWQPSITHPVPENNSRAVPMQPKASMPNMTVQAIGDESWRRTPGFLQGTLDNPRKTGYSNLEAAKNQSSPELPRAPPALPAAGVNLYDARTMPPPPLPPPPRSYPVDGSIDVQGQVPAKHPFTQYALPLEWSNAPKEWSNGSGQAMDDPSQVPLEEGGGTGNCPAVDLGRLAQQTEVPAVLLTPTKSFPESARSMPTLPNPSDAEAQLHLMVGKARFEQHPKPAGFDEQISSRRPGTPGRPSSSRLHSTSGPGPASHGSGVRSNVRLPPLPAPAPRSGLGIGAGQVQDGATEAIFLD